MPAILPKALPPPALPTPPAPKAGAAFDTIGLPISPSTFAAGALTTSSGSNLTAKFELPDRRTSNVPPPFCASPSVSQISSISRSEGGPSASAPLRSSCWSSRPASWKLSLATGPEEESWRQAWQMARRTARGRLEIECRGATPRVPKGWADQAPLVLGVMLEPQPGVPIPGGPKELGEDQLPDVLPKVSSRLCPGGAANMGEPMDRPLCGPKGLLVRRLWTADGNSSSASSSNALLPRCLFRSSPSPAAALFLPPGGLTLEGR